MDVDDGEYELVGPLLTDEALEGLTVSELERPVSECGGLQVLPWGLLEWLPGAHLAAVVSSVDRRRLSGYDLVCLLQARQRLVSHYQAGMYADMVEVSHRSDPGRGYEEEAYVFASDEIRAALTLTRRSANIELDTALDLYERLPALGAALDSGVLDLRRARTITMGTGHVDQSTARMVTDRILDTAPKSTTGQIAARLRKLCITINPDDASREYHSGLEDRRVWTEINPDGTANLHGYNLAPHRVQAITDRINQLARRLKTRTETRTLDQVRADILVDLLVTDHTSGEANPNSSRHGHVDITVELGTLAGLDDHPGELAGMGPVIADIARQTIREQADSTWTYTVTDQGRPVATGTTRRRPTNTITRQVQAQYQTCVFPGCRLPARSCDLDHHNPRTNNGPTQTTNLAPLCRHDHQLKHDRWTLTRRPNSDHTWTSPLGHTYTTSGPSP